VSVLAELEEDRGRRRRELGLGLAVAIPLALLVFGVAVPRLAAWIRGGAGELDARLRAAEAVMSAACGEAMDPERDAALCSCVAGSEAPGLDCAEPYARWRLERHAQRCAVAQLRASALSFCTCVDAVLGDSAPASAAGDGRGGARPAGAGALAPAWERCAALPDAEPASAVLQP